MDKASGESKYAKRLAARRRMDNGAEHPIPRSFDSEYFPKHYAKPDIVVDEKAKVFWQFNTFIPAARIYQHKPGDYRYKLP